MGWPGDHAHVRTAPPPNETGCKVAMLHCSCIARHCVKLHHSLNHALCHPEFLPQIKMWPPQTAAARNAPDYCRHSSTSGTPNRHTMAPPLYPVLGTQTFLCLVQKCLRSVRVLMWLYVMDCFVGCHCVGVYVSTGSYAARCSRVT